MAFGVPAKNAVTFGATSQVPKMTGIDPPSSEEVISSSPGVSLDFCPLRIMMKDAIAVMAETTKAIMANITQSPLLRGCLPAYMESRENYPYC